jgi:hypothetical protein
LNIRDCFPGTPSVVWEFIEDAARKDWARLTDFDDSGPLFNLDCEGLKPSTIDIIDATRRGMYEEYGGAIKGVLWLYALSRVVAEGPKVFRPTLEQCEALEHVELNFPMKDFRQPYPTMIVEFPTEYRRSVDARTGGIPACPRCVVVKHWEQGVAMTGCMIVDKHGLPAELVYIFGAKANCGTLEDVMGIYMNTDKAETAVLEAMTRVALNLVVLLAHSSSRLIASNPDILNKCKEKLRKGIRPELQRKEIAQHVHFVVPEKPVIVRETRQQRNGDTNGNHASPKTHWRRGHWRAAPGFALAKGAGEKVPLVFVRPCLVIGSGEGEPEAPVYIPA